MVPPVMGMTRRPSNSYLNSCRSSQVRKLSVVHGRSSMVSMTASIAMSAALLNPPLRRAHNPATQPRRHAMSQIQLRHGIFLPPFHPMDENPAACMDRDLELMQWLDRLGFHEAWIGEHHSAGWETISSPELFIAVAAERTRSIRFGTGVISLPYHNPLMVANRIIQLDHHTRGRVMFGAGT